MRRFDLGRRPLGMARPSPAAVVRRRVQRGVLRRERRARAGARVFLFRGGAGAAQRGEADDPRRGAALGGQLRQAAGAAAAANQPLAT